MLFIYGGETRTGLPARRSITYQNIPASAIGPTLRFQPLNLDAILGRLLGGDIHRLAEDGHEGGAAEAVATTVAKD
ncbi:MAG TPA: hypothetical protein PKJ51_04255, partial [Methanothrix sp.]|nr:hypothetical protein [Methanothrix sp.]